MGFDALASIAAAAFIAQPAPAPQPSCSFFEGPPAFRNPYDVFIIFFDRGSAEITPAAAPILDRVAETYRPLPHCQLHVWAHTDRVGSEAYNLALSQRRGRAIVEYLRRAGVLARPRIEALGETRPLVDTADDVEERQNRRAEILIQPRDRP